MAQPASPQLAATIVEIFRATAQAHPRAFAKCHNEGDPEAWDFIYLACQACKRQLATGGPVVGCNGKRGSDTLSYDAIAIKDSASSPNTDVRVVDMVTGAGAPGAAVGFNDVTQFGPGKYFDPDSFTPVFGGGAPVPAPTPPPAPAATVPEYEAIGGDQVFREKIGKVLQADYIEAKQTLNDGSAVWFARPIYWAMRDIVLNRTEPTRALDAAIARYRKEWRAVLGLPVTP